MFDDWQLPTEKMKEEEVWETQIFQISVRVTSAGVGVTVSLIQVQNSNLLLVAFFSLIIWKLTYGLSLLIHSQSE